MTFIPTQSGFMNLKDSEKLLRAIFPNYPSLEPCHRPPSLEPIAQGQRRSEQLAMFYITAGTCRFTLAEILIMAAMHLETIRLIPEDRVRTKTAAARRG